MTEPAQNKNRIPERFLKFLLYLDALGTPFEDTFTWRKKAAKILYLLKQFGATGLEEYRFAWYIHGPYSPQLTRDFYKAFELLRDSRK